MLEILFTESAAGSMKFAKGLKKTAAEAFGFIYVTEDGHEPTPEELQRERAKLEEERRNKLQNAIPVEGNPRDVLHFPLGLSMGDISQPFSDHRMEYLQSTVLIGGPDFSKIGQELMDTARKSLERVLSAEGPVRIWYSRNPDEFCGFCHILTVLPENTDIRVVELPEYAVMENELRTYTGWGEVDPFAFGQFQRLERPLTGIERRYFANQWRDLVRENGALRAVVNGQLVTVDADFYDCFILRELEQEPEEPDRFHEGRLIGRILGKYPLGLSDSLVALRIEEFISRGMLVPATAATEGRPIYHRYLRRVRSGNRISDDDWRLLSVDEDLKYKEINPTDGEEIGRHAPDLTHCAFCWTQVEHTRQQHWFLPTDLSCCICEKCYYDFKKMFHWRELDGWDLEWDKEG